MSATFNTTPQTASNTTTAGTGTPGTKMEPPGRRFGRGGSGPGTGRRHIMNPSGM